MKSSFFLFTVLFALAFISGCKENKTGIVTAENSGKYPTALNTEWEYETLTYLAKYDKNGNLGNDSLFEPASNTTVKITSVNDSINEEKNLIRFDFSSNQNYSAGSHWYRNADSAFIFIAYSGMERNWVTPKLRKSNSLNFLKYLTTNFLPEETIVATNDSIYLSKRIVIPYPLKIGRSWDIFLSSNWHVTKTVLGKKDLLFNRNNVSCFDIKSNYNSFVGTDIHDYINFDVGLVRREIISDSTAFTGPDSPDPLYYGKIKITSNLIRKSN